MEDIICKNDKIIQIDKRLLRRCRTYRLCMKDSDGENIIVPFSFDEMKEFENFLYQEKIEIDDVDKIIGIVTIANFLEYDGYISKTEEEMKKHIVEKIYESYGLEKENIIDIVFSYLREKSTTKDVWGTIFYLTNNIEIVYRDTGRILDNIIEEEKEYERLNKEVNKICKDNDTYSNIPWELKIFFENFLCMYSMIDKEGVIEFDTNIYSHAKSGWHGLVPDEYYRNEEMLKKRDIIKIGKKGKKIAIDDIANLYEEIKKIRKLLGVSYYLLGINKKGDKYMIEWG